MSAPAGAASADPLTEALSGVEPPIPGEAREQLSRLFEMLCAWKGAGIVGFRSAEDLARHYFREALLLGRLLPARGPFLDIGSGGGTPALPLAIAAGGRWLLLEPRQVSAAFLEMAADSLGLGTRVRVVRQRLKQFLRSPTGLAELARVSAVTMRAVKLQPGEWAMLAAGMSAGTPVIWPTSRPARDRAELASDLFDEEFVPADRGVVWIGRPRTPSR
ncbi:MAG: class I SAM-dependent methyltransferase [Acidobacteriota bacterium]|nr:class I SAM-dependent methyltransferase [Acidobacteriota bacterium]